MRSSTAKSILVMLVIFIPAGMVVPQTPPPASGDWDVLDVTSYDNTTLTVNGNLTVMSGGRLELDNITLIMNCTRSGQYAIRVESGGELQAMNCVITSPAADRYYTFQIYGKAALGLTRIERVWNDTHVAKGGVEIYNGNVTINECTIANCSRYGLYIDDADPVISGCNINLCTLGIKVDSNSGPAITFNNIENCSAGIAVMKTSTPDIKNNTIAGGKFGIEALDNSQPNISDNNIAQCEFGIVITDDSGATASDNDLTGLLNCAIDIETNTRQDGKPLIRGNTMVLDPIFQNMDTYGIKNLKASNATIEQNEIYNFRVGIFNIDNSGSRIERNNISNSYIGIYNCNNSKPAIINNAVFRSRDKDFGIVNVDDSNATIDDNTIDRNTVGISNKGSSHPTIINNTISNNSNGIENSDYSHPNILHNTILNNINDGILNVWKSYPTIEDNDIRFNQYRGIENNDNCTPNITANRIFNNTIFGVVNHNNSNVTMSNNTISNHSWAAIIISDRSITGISNGSVNNNTYGIQSLDSSTVTVMNVEVCDNSNSSLSGSADSTLKLSNDRISNNGMYGVFADGRCTITIEHCTIADNHVGIYLSTNNGKTISNNTISGGRTEYGFELDRCSPDLTDCRISGTKNGILFINSSSNVSNMTVENYDDFGFLCDASSRPNLINSTFRTNNLKDYNVTGFSHPVLINTSYYYPWNVPKQDFSGVINGTCSVSICWYTRFNVVDSRQRPLNGADVTFTSTKAHHAVTDQKGSVREFLLEEQLKQQGKPDPKTYYTVTIEKDGDTYLIDNDLNICRTWNHTFQYDYAPHIKSIPDLTIQAQNYTELDLANYLTDHDHDKTALQIILGPGQEKDHNVSVGPDGKTLLLNYSGPIDEDIVWFTVTDGIRNTTGNVTVHVSRKNRPPVWHGPSSLTLNDTELVDLDLSKLLDVEQAFNELSIAVESDYGDKYVKRHDIFYLTVQYPEGVTHDRIILRIDDGNGGFLNVTIDVTILHINRPPVINGALEIRPNEGENYTYDLEGRIIDPDGPLADVTLNCSSTKYCTVSGHTLVFRYPEGMRGENVTITVTDAKGGNTTYPVEILVRAVNQRPIVSPVPTLIVEAGTEYHFNLRPYITDLDLPEQKLTVTTSAQYVNISGFNVTFFYPRDTSSEARNLAFSVNDGMDRTDFIIPVKITSPKVKREFISEYGTLIFVLLPIAIIATAAGIIVYRRVRYGWYEVKRAFLVNQDGRMLAHYGEKQEADDEMLVSSMLTAVQQFIDEAMKKEHAGDIKEFQYEDMKIAIEKGDRIFLALFLKGYATEGLRKEMKQMVVGLEKKFTRDIADWDGRITDKGFITEAEMKLKALTKKK